MTEQPLRTIDIIMQMKQNGHASRLIVQGLLSTKSIMYADIASMYAEKKSKTKRRSTTYIVNTIAEHFKVSERTVYKALHVMEVSHKLPAYY